MSSPTFIQIGVITRLGRLLDSLAADGSRQTNRPPTPTSASHRLPPTAVGGNTAKRRRSYRLAVFPPISIGGKTEVASGL
jgi:hypothetical protein